MARSAARSAQATAWRRRRRPATTPASGGRSRRPGRRRRRGRSGARPSGGAASAVRAVGTSSRAASRIRSCANRRPSSVRMPAATASSSAARPSSRSVARWHGPGRPGPHRTPVRRPRRPARGTTGRAGRAGRAPRRGPRPAADRPVEEPARRPSSPTKNGLPWVRRHDGGRDRGGHRPAGDPGEVRATSASPSPPSRSRVTVDSRASAAIAARSGLLPGGLGVAVGRDHHQPGRRHRRGHVDQQPQRRRVGPVDVVEHDQQPRAAGRARPGPRSTASKAGTAPAPTRPPSGVGPDRHPPVAGQRPEGLAERPVRRVPSSSLARPSATASPARAPRSAASSASRVLPTPGSPATSTTCRRPSSAARRHSSTTARSATRPIRASRGAARSAATPSPTLSLSTRLRTRARRRRPSTSFNRQKTTSASGVRATHPRSRIQPVGRQWVHFRRVRLPLGSRRWQRTRRVPRRR